MSLTPSNMLPIGTRALDFILPSTEGTAVDLASQRGDSGTVILFICNHCPYVIHIADALAKTAREYMPKGIGFVAINSNDASEFPEDSMENMIREKQNRNYPFPYLFDDSQEVARSYDAACTPDIYLFNSDLRLVYRGQFDESRPQRISSGNYVSRHEKPTGKDLRAAMDCLLQGIPITSDQKPSIGCNIKWKPDIERVG
ncbi:MAG: thioredoxin family protein [Gammaproteobacteria bacterium]|nr:thioredoxin family protein [Gammaproteobacteria bacterium]MCY4218213.1 thioredoxin family protein [Gammaproteobacteria bacterium]